MKDIAARIAAARTARAPFAAEPELADIEAGLAAQDLVTGLLAPAAGGVAGYKISWNTGAAMARMGLPHPGYGRVLAEGIRESGAVLEAAAYREFMMEPEIAAVIGADMAPRAGGWDAASVLAHVARWVPAFELLDRRGGGAVPHVPTILAGNIFNDGAVLGGPGAPADTDFSALETVVSVGGEELLRQAGAAPQPPAEALAFIADRFNARGITLRAGDIVLCGTHMPVTPVPAGAEAVMSVTGLGEVRFSMR
ncbi:2-keto-4-pentenoate hydratase [Oceanicella sp. SM1341]|uniref:2-keto-4-pentenoate hydratase n=1 Tax=Oceanicella sp. SM1341 TaxID=1548889 RepID=UPI000E47DA4A|nr:fumarylacetoacetate hydrolase family protein [Oceanicella sp. SM1341]